MNTASNNQSNNQSNSQSNKQSRRRRAEDRLGEITRRRNRLVKRFRLWARRTGLNRKLAFALAVAAVMSGVATFGTMTGTSTDGGGPDPETVLALLYLDVVLLLLLGALVARRLALLWTERRRGLAGSGLHVRLVLSFSLVAVTPAILVAIFAGLFLNFGIQAWFSERVSTALEESRSVAKAYLYEHQQNIRADAFAMANDLNRVAPNLINNPARFSRAISTQAALRSLPEALVVDSTGRVLARTEFSLSLAFDLVPQAAILKANRGEIAVITNDDDDRVRAVIRLNRFVDAYLLVGRFVESGVLDHIDATEQAVAQYKRLEEKRGGIQITFVLIFIVVALLLLLAAVWIGLNLATRLARPISNLISAAEEVRKGDMSVRVDASQSADEIGTLSRAFNRMTSQLETQQSGLLDANRQLDERRRFTETVLSGVSAGVIGLDGNGRIHLPNRSASELLSTDLEEYSAVYLGEVVPEMAELLATVMTRPDRVHQSEVKVVRRGQIRTLLVNMAAEKMGDSIVGYVVTFDDVTDLLSAQRTAAWADVARRIAHEIKNPLTPIQLSAERLKRRYLKQIETDPETFAACTDTIVRQVEDIGRMVDEFSSFARMPHPVLKLENLSEICRHAFFLESNRHPEINFNQNQPADDVFLNCDARQVSRVLTNLLKNAAESVLGRKGSDLPVGEVSLTLAEGKADTIHQYMVTIEDNGIGLPEDHRDRLTEPYVTTRTKGTGLGLAIVKKIMEDHGGDLILEDREGGGARICVAFRQTEGIDSDSEPSGDGGEMPDPLKVATSILSHGT